MLMLKILRIGLGREAIQRIWSTTTKRTPGNPSLGCSKIFGRNVPGIGGTSVPLVVN